MQVFIFIIGCGLLFVMYAILSVLSDIRTNLYKINDTLTGIDRSIINKEFRRGIK